MTQHTDSVEAIVEEINQMIPCLDSYCDKHGTTVGGTHPETGEQEPLQCEYCYRERFPILDRIRTTLQATQSQQVEEAVRQEACLWFNEWYDRTISKTATDSNDFGKWATMRLQEHSVTTPNHQD